MAEREAPDNEWRVVDDPLQPERYQWRCVDWQLQIRWHSAPDGGPGAWHHYRKGRELTNEPAARLAMFQDLFLYPLKLSPRE